MLYQLSSRLNNSRVVLARLEIETAHQLAEYKLEHKEEVRRRLSFPSRFLQDPCPHGLASFHDVILFPSAD